METNKLLTLEEIEEIEKGVGKHYMTVKADVAFDLLATARAYWELKKKEVHVSCGQCGLSTCVQRLNEYEDK